MGSSGNLRKNGVELPVCVYVCMGVCGGVLITCVFGFVLENYIPLVNTYKCVRG